MGLLRVHPRPASRGTTPSWRTLASPFRRALACTARGIPGPLHDQRRRQRDPRPGRRSPTRHLSPLNHAMAWQKEHEGAAAASRWLWAPNPVSERLACDVRGRRQVYRRSKLAPSCRGLNLAGSGPQRGLRRSSWLSQWSTPLVDELSFGSLMQLRSVKPAGSARSHERRTGRARRGRAEVPCMRG